MPATPASPQTLGSLGEQRLIAHLRDWLGPACPPTPRGPGDDCSLLPRPPGRLLVTTDPVIRDRHFTADTPPAAVAAKLLHRNLSDRRAGVEIAGGDCARTDGFLALTLTLLGDAPPRPLLRTGARRGDVLFVTGALGGSILGRHLRFTPRLAEGRWLARRPGVRAAIDVSDGLGKDLPALLSPLIRAEVDTSALPVSAAARRLAAGTGRHPLDHVLNDGEDFELLFTVAPGCADKLATAWSRRFATPLHRIGRLLPASPDRPRLGFSPPLPAGVVPHGYEHFL
jgi:thiamine-monophosphate kinase